MLKIVGLKAFVLVSKRKQSDIIRALQTQCKQIFKLKFVSQFGSQRICAHSHGPRYCPSHPLPKTVRVDRYCCVFKR